MNELRGWGTVTAVSYSESQGVAIVSVKGHVTAAVQRGYSLLEGIFVNKRWRITYCTYSPPSWDHLASEGQITMQAEEEKQK